MGEANNRATAILPVTHHAPMIIVVYSNCVRRGIALSRGFKEVNLSSGPTSNGKASTFGAQRISE